MDAFVNGGGDYLGVVLDVAFYGLHVGIYGLYVGIHRDRGVKIFRGISHIASTVSFILSTFFAVFNIICIYFELTNQFDAHATAINQMSNASSCFYALIDIIAQWLLIYRCWIIWDKRYSVVALPTLLAFGALWFNLVGVIIPSVKPLVSINFNALTSLATAAYTCSMAVNAIVTFSIVGRIWYLSRKFAKVDSERSNRRYNIIMSMLLESGVTILVAQIIWLVLYLQPNAGYSVITGAVTQIYGFTPTVILIRVALGKSYHETEATRMTKSIAFNHDVAPDSSVSYGGTFSNITSSRLPGSSSEALSSLEMNLGGSKEKELGDSS